MRKKSGSIQNRGTSFRISYYDIHGGRQYESFKTQDEARRELAKRLSEVAQGIPISSKPNTVTFGELAKDVENDYIANGYRSLRQIKSRFRLHILPIFRKRKASQITRAQLMAYIVLRKDGGASIGSINRELEAVRHTFKLALDGRKILHMPKVPHLRENNVRTGFFTREEVDRLCLHLEPPYNSVVLFGFLTGWRWGEIQGLLWENIDFQRWEIRLDAGTTKNREGRFFPMSDELLELLELARHPAPTAKDSNPSLANTPVIVNSKRMPALTPYVFRLNGRKIGPLRNKWKIACHKAGLPCVIDTKGRVIKALRTFHDLRRSFAREMDKLGARHGAIMKLGGWKTDSVFRRYNIVSDGDLRDAINMIDSARDGAKRGTRESGNQ